jgi:hypothetical protein
MSYADATAFAASLASTLMVEIVVELDPWS